MIVGEITSERLYIEKKSQVEPLGAVNTYTSERRDWSNKGDCEGVASEVEVEAEIYEASYGGSYEIGSNASAESEDGGHVCTFLFYNIIFVNVLHVLENVCVLKVFSP